MSDLRYATLIGDVVGSREHADRRTLHRRLNSTLKRSGSAHPWVHAPSVTAGDEFEATYATVGEAIGAATAIRLELLPDIDLRFGIGFGTVTAMGPRTSNQDGPGWWSARAAIEEVATRAGRGATHSARMAFRSDDEHAPPVAGVDAALACLDALLGQLDARSIRLLRGMMADRRQHDLADAEGISTSAVSQRVKVDSLAVITYALAQLTRL